MSFEIYVLISGFGCFVLSYWFIPTKLSGKENFIGSLYMLGFGCVLWPIVVLAAIKSWISKRKQNDRQST